MTAETLEPSIYQSGEYAQTHPGWHEEESDWKVGHIVQGLNKAGVVPSSISDIGCGAGRIIYVLSERFPLSNCTGYDISPQALALASRYRRNNLSYSSGDPFEHRVDLAMAIDVFEHVEDYRGFVRKVRSISQFQVYHIPLDLSAQSVLRGQPLAKHRKTIGHIHLFNKEAALGTLEETGHSILHWHYTSAVVLAAHSVKSRLLSGPRRLLEKIAPDFNARTLGGYSILAVCG